MATRMVQFRVDNNQHFFEIIEADGVIYTSDKYDEIEECIDIGIHMMDTFHEENPLRETGVPPTVNPRNYRNPRNSQED